MCKLRKDLKTNYVMIGDAKTDRSTHNMETLQCAEMKTEDTTLHGTNLVQKEGDKIYRSTGITEMDDKYIWRQIKLKS